VSHKDFGIIQLKLTNVADHDNVLSTMRDFILKRPESHIVLFNSYSDVINSHNVPILHINQGKFFYGRIIVFDIESLKLALSFVNISEIIYYANTIPWGKTPEKFSYWDNIFNQDNLKIVAANENIYNIFSIGFKTPVSIASEFTYEEFKHII